MVPRHHLRVLATEEAEQMKQINWAKHRVWSAEMIASERAAIDAQHYGRWGKAIEVEVRKRILVSVAAYAYEVENHTIMDDHVWDELAQTINPQLGTCHPVVDEFFLIHFSPMTGMWIHKHPELEGIERIYNRHHANTGK